MSERFSKLFALPGNLYCAGAPVMIATFLYRAYH